MWRNSKKRIIFVQEINNHLKLTVMQKLSLEQLAEKLNGNLWVKGDLKRVYLDKGWNTKKMSTKTYVEEVNGEFVVKCFIDCPSQPWNWIKSQQEEVIESVERQIQEIISEFVYLVMDAEGNYYDNNGNKTSLNEIYSDYYYHQNEADQIVEQYGFVKDGEFNLKVVVMDRSEFEAEIERLEEIERNMSISEKLKRGDSIGFNKNTYEDVIAKISESGINPDEITASIHHDYSGHFRMAKQDEKSYLDIFAEFKAREKTTEETLKVEQKEKEVQQESNSKQNFGVGAKLKHPRFGIGVAKAETDESVTIEFDDAEIGTKKLLKLFVKLEIID